MVTLERVLGSKKTSGLIWPLELLRNPTSLLATEMAHVILRLAILLSLAKTGQSIASSAWCHGSHQDHRHCTFTNLCYSPFHAQFLFFHAKNESVMSGIDEPGEQVKLVRLSSVAGKSDLYLNYVSLPTSASDNYDIEFVDTPLLVVKRWRPLDPFHIFHDDLLPIYLTLKYLCQKESVSECLNDYIIAFDDEVKSSLYEALLPNIMYLAKYSAYFGEHQLLCFKKATVGLETESLWHDHGFDSGSVSRTIHDINLRPHLIEEFRSFALHQLGIENSRHSQDHDDEVLIFASEKFKNPLEVKSILEEKYKMKVTLLKPSQMSTPDLIRQVCHANILVGFHDPYNILSLFLPKTSGLLELFPFGLDQSSLSHVAGLADIRKIRYSSWINFDRSLSEPGKMGEEILSHLDADTAQAIRKMDYVGAVLCCNDPALTYKLDQVTTVGISDFVMAFEAFVSDMKAPINELEFEDRDEWLIPSPVFNGKCRVEADRGPVLVSIEWHPPLNLEFIPHDRVIYEILIEAESYEGASASNDFLGEFSTSEPTISFSSHDINLKKHRSIKAAIVSVLDNDLRSGEAFVFCALDPL